MLISRPVGQNVKIFFKFKEYEYVKDGLLSMTEPSALVVMRQLKIILRANCDKVIADKCVLQKLMTVTAE